MQSPTQTALVVATQAGDEVAFGARFRRKKAAREWRFTHLKKGDRTSFLMDPE
jgi:hypothetical protein